MIDFLQLYERKKIIKYEKYEYYQPNIRTELIKGRSLLIYLLFQSKACRSNHLTTF